MSSRVVSFHFLRELARYPGTLLALCLALIGISLVMLQSAGLTPDGRLLPYFSRQIVWASAGLAVFFTLSFVPYDKLGRRWLPIYLLGLIALLLVFVIGTRVNGARRWFAIGTVRIQPSEFMKYAVVIGLAHVVARRGHMIKTWGGLFEAAVLVGIPFTMVAAQPDLGTALTYLPILAAMVFAAGARTKHLVAVGLVALLCVPVAWTCVLKQYQKDRVYAFLDPEAHKDKGSYQTNQSVIAVGAGGLTGRGYKQGTQGTLGFLPERHTDFIFAVVCEDFGLIGGVLLLGLYAYLICTLGRIATTTRDMEGRLIVVGVATVTLTQIAVNVGMALGICPVTGLTLPLVSYGGSSMVASLIGFGLAASVARSRVRRFR